MPRGRGEVRALAALLALLQLAGCRAADPTSARPLAASNEADEGEAEQPQWLHGSVRARYRGRWAGSADDHDLYTTFDLEGGDQEKDALTFHALGNVAWDIDGQPASEDDFVFFSLRDTFDSRLNGRLYSGYADFHKVDELDLLRVGRQQVDDAPVFAYFDGVRLESNELGSDKVRLGLYGGIPVHHYESSTSGDSLLGFFGQARPWWGARVRLDYMRLEDELVFGPNENELTSLAYGQNVGTTGHVEGSYSLLDGDERDFRVRGTAYYPDSEVLLEVNFYRLLQEQRSLAKPLDPFFETLFELVPYFQTRVLLSKSFGESGAIEAGADFRSVENAQQIGDFNRDFDRYYATLRMDEGLPKDVSVSLTSEVWDDGPNRVSTWGLDVSKRTEDRKRELSLGSYFSLFKYEYYSDFERDNVRTYYVDLATRPTDDRRYDLRYEFEDSPIDQFHRLMLGVTWLF